MFDKIIGFETTLAWPLKYWLVGLVSLIVAVAATWLCEKIALRLGIVDKPDNLVKTHRKPIPYLGGVGIFIGLAAGILTALVCLPADYPPIARKWLLGIISAGAIACAVGCIDDLVDIRPWQKVLGQVAAGLVLVAVGITPTLYSLDQPAKLIVDTVFVMVFVLGATNSLNLLDGLDGLCAGVTIVCAGGMLLLAMLMGSVQSGLQGDPVRAIVCLALLGSVCGFLPFNYHPARIFMGDAGSLLLGLNMAALIILFAEKTPQFWLGSVVIFGLPILDTAVAFARRLVNKRPLFVSDRGHIYDQMMDRGLSVRKTVALCYGLTALYAIMGLIVGLLPMLTAVAICAAVVFVSAFAVWKKEYLKMTGLRGANPQNSPHHSTGNRVD
jgi:UDP-GlcNAc:undecaprenyl-phosphate GlcNAc-1-phosphate transferase